MKKYIFSSLYTLGIMIIGTLISSTLYYFNLIGDNLNKIMLYLISIIAIFVGAIKLGKSISQKGIITGLVYFTIWLFIMIFLSLVVFKINLGFKNILYYLILLVFSMLGGILGKNSQEETDIK